MKRLLLLLFFIPFISLAQVPQGVGYQGVATDANGIELVNQSISIRASVLSGSANGTVEWEETHATSTDTFGLFALTIGEGTSTGNGAQLSFADISWGTNTHFLKIEMDVTGGANYSFMGTNQMMSVPYALYAESANINYDSISNLLSNDSTFITNIGGGMGGGCDWKFPDGLDGEAIVWDFSNGDYTIPSGKTLYMLQATSWDYFVSEISTGMATYLGGIPSGSVFILSDDYEVTDANSSGAFNGILVQSNVTPIVWDFSNGDYTIPSGKTLYMLQATSWDYFVSEISTGMATYLGGIPSGSVFILSDDYEVTDANSSGAFNGYLVDENYFAGCGGGGGSSATTIDYDSLANIISMDSTFAASVSGGMGGGCNFNYPDGLDGEPIVHDFVANGPYTVPAGKNLYTNMILHNTADDIFINSKKIWNSGLMFSNLNIILSEDDVISLDTMLSTTKVMFGLLVDKKVQSLTYDFLANGAYTVPSGKNLYIYRIYHNAQHCEVNSKAIATNGIFTGDAFLNHHLILKSGDIIDIIDNGGGGFENMFGYLADENYFAGCGGGGSSSSSTINNQINNYNNILNHSFTSGTFNYIFSNYPTSITYTVPVGKIMKITSTQSANYGNTNPVLINGNQWTPNAAIPDLLSEGTQLEIQFDSPGDFMNLQYDLIDNTQGIMLQYIFSNYPTSITYTVPVGKIMKITSTQSANYGNTNPVLINGNQWTPNAAIPDLLSEGTQLEIQFDSPGDFMNLQYILFDN